MKEELIRLLHRAEEAGAPLRLASNTGHGTLQMSGLLTAGELTAFLLIWEPVDSAALIHLLKEDAVQRGVTEFAETAEKGKRCVTFLTTGEDNPVSRGKHKEVACAWLLAWLDAFEDNSEKVVGGRNAPS